ncbi:hypothetical protein [Halobacillus salinus]|uniref:DUF2768 domain-containing protein n=1 Tax=Halobacillus salinus TaxID=192814 RepID=A0A4Z0GZT2_9BACI|nr:hypothetical protein [Halobacillus salinus]TGB03713.1 hypothetical protein E4663_01540 [Halobacillus salinus]
MVKIGHVLLTGILLVLASLLTIKGFKQRSLVRKFIQMSFLALGIFLIGMSVVGIVSLGGEISKY